MVHGFVNLGDEGVGGQQGVDEDDTLGVLDLLGSQKLVAGGVVGRVGLTGGGELLSLNAHITVRIGLYLLPIEPRGEAQSGNL